MSIRNDPDTGIMTVATLLTTASLVLSAVATGVVVAIGAVPEEFSDIAGQIMPFALLGGAIAMGMGSVGKGLWKIGSSREEVVKLNIASAKVDTE